MAKERPPERRSLCRSRTIKQKGQKVDTLPTIIRVKGSEPIPEPISMFIEAMVAALVQKSKVNVKEFIYI